MTVRRLLSALLALCLAGCALVDAEQDSLCRRAIPALFDASSGIRVLQSQTEGERGVSVRFWLASDARNHRIDCLFEGSGLNPAKRRLTGLAADGQMLGTASFYYIATRWLETRFAIAETPAAAAGHAVLANVSPGTAYALQHFLSNLPKAAIYALTAAAFALIYGVCGRINLVFGSFAALGGISAVMTVMLVEAAGWRSIPTGILAALLVSIVLAGFYGKVLASQVLVPLYRRPGQQALIASLGLMIGLEEFLRLAQGSNSLWLPPVFNAPVTVARSSLYDATVTPMAIATASAGAAAAVYLNAYMRTSHFGRQWRAVADDPVAAALFGVSANAIMVRSFVIAAVLAAFSGYLIVSYYGGIGFAGGTMLGLTALAAAILGGIGSIVGAMLGGVLIAAAEGIWSAFFPIEHKDLMIFVALVTVLVLKPDGLFGGRVPGPMRV